MILRNTKGKSKVVVVDRYLRPFNPLSSKSDKHTISPQNITTLSRIRLLRKKGNEHTKDKRF